MTETVIFGATGQAGAEVVHALTAMEFKPRVFSRDVAKVTDLFGNTVTPVEGNFDDPAAIAEAVKGVDSLFLSCPVNPQQVAWQGRILDAVSAFKPLVVKLSGLATAAESYVDSGRWHAETENRIRQLQLPHVFLHPYFFLQNLKRLVIPALQSGVLSTGDAKVEIAPVDVRDIGAVAAQLLSGAVDRTGATLVLTATETFNYESLAELLGELAEQKFELVERSEVETQKLLLKTGMPQWHIEILLQFNRAFADGLGAQITNDVENVLGRAPLSPRSYLATLLN